MKSMINNVFQIEISLGIKLTKAEKCIWKVIDTDSVFSKFDPRLVDLIERRKVYITENNRSKVFIEKYSELVRT